MPRLNGMMEPFDDTLFPLPDPTPEKPRARAGDRANYTPFNPGILLGIDGCVHTASPQRLWRDTAMPGAPGIRRYVLHRAYPGARRRDA